MAGAGGSVGGTEGSVLGAAGEAPSAWPGEAAAACHCVAPSACVGGTLLGSEGGGKAVLVPAPGCTDSGAFTVCVGRN